MLPDEGFQGGPFQRGATMNWLFLDRIERKKTKLYDARPIIRKQLEDRRLQEIANSEFERMMARASFTDLNLMAQRLLQIAERWYLEPVLAGRAGGSGGGRP